MIFEHRLVLLATAALMASAVLATETEMKMEKVEDSTESPPHVADMAAIDAAVKTSTEQPPVAAAVEKPLERDVLREDRPHGVANFIVHPLIALRQRTPFDNGASGKQASGSSTPSPWTLFGFNAGQGLGSSVSNIAGSVGNWLNSRIQLPNIVEALVPTTTTTTSKPNIVVHVQHSNTPRRPAVQLNNGNRPQISNNLSFDSEENDGGLENDEDDADDDEDDEQPNNDDDDGSFNRDQDDDAEEEEYEGYPSGEEFNSDDDGDADEPVVRPQRQNNRKPKPNAQQRRRYQNRNQFGQRQQPKQRLRVQQVANIEDNYDVDDFAVDDDDDNENPRSQGQSNYMISDQQNMLDQIHQLARGQSPIRYDITRSSQSEIQRRRPQAMLIINRNGQTIYMAPELLNQLPMMEPPQPQTNAQNNNKKRPSSSEEYPSPPLTTPQRKKGAPTQYITLPWTQLGISPPNNLHAITEGVQSQPFLLNIPQSAIFNMLNGRPSLTPDAVPLLNEASNMDIFGSLPAFDMGSALTSNPTSVIHVTSKLRNSNKRKAAASPQKRRPAPIVEEAIDTESMEKPNASVERAEEKQTLKEGPKSEQEYIIVGDDDEPGLERKVPPVLGEARYRERDGFQHYFVNKGRFALRRNGRGLEQVDNISIIKAKPTAGKQTTQGIGSDTASTLQKKPVDGISSETRQNIATRRRN